MPTFLQEFLEENPEALYAACARAPHRRSIVSELRPHLCVAPSSFHRFHRWVWGVLGKL